MTMSKTILVVEDNVNERITLVDILTEKGYKVVEAADGEEGLKKIKEERPDLILLDILIPKINGYNFLKRLKLDESTKSIPVITVTAKAGMEELFATEGIVGYIVKPFDNEILLEKIKNTLEQEGKR